MSYDSSLSGIKNGIFNFKKGGTRAEQAISLERPAEITELAELKHPGGNRNIGDHPLVGAEEVPNKPEDKTITMNSKTS